MKRTPLRKVSKKQAIRNREWNKTVAFLVADRAKYHCENCGQLPDWRGLQGHHIIKRRFNNDDPDNIEILCAKCHNVRHFIYES